MTAVHGDTSSKKSFSSIFFLFLSTSAYSGGRSVNRADPINSHCSAAAAASPLPPAPAEEAAKRERPEEIEYYCEY